MDVKGRCLGNIFIERLLRSLKYECVHLHAWQTGSQAKAGVGRWIAFYNHQRPHAAHGGQPPAMTYFNQIETDQQGQKVAKTSPGPVQEMGSSSVTDHHRTAAETEAAKPLGNEGPFRRMDPGAAQTC